MLFWLSYAGKLFEPTAGIEPATFALRKRCTTVVLRGRSGAGDGIRTHDLRVGNATFYC